MKVYEIARLRSRSAQLNGPVIVRKLPKRGEINQKILQFLDTNPGATAFEIGKYIHPELSAMAAQRRVGISLWALRQKNKIHSRTLDGRMRHYKRKEEITEKKISPQEIEKQQLPVITFPDRVKQYDAILSLAKDYFWDTNDHDLRNFIKWLEDKNALT